MCVCARICVCVCACEPAVMRQPARHNVGRPAACPPSRLPAHLPPLPKPAGTFALWLQFPGMPNLRQLFTTCYLCQQCFGSAATSAATLSPSGGGGKVRSRGLGFVSLCVCACMKITVFFFLPKKRKKKTLPTSVFALASVCVSAQPSTLVPKRVGTY